MTFSVKSVSSRTEKRTDDKARMDEMSKAAAIAVSLHLASIADKSRSNGHAEPSSIGHVSAWVLNSRMAMTSRWPGW
jgi:hypothetical protein